MPHPLHPNMTYVGKVHGFKPEKAYEQDEVRNYFGAKPNQKLIYLSSGGGGDLLSEEVIDKWLTTLRNAIPEPLVVVGYGPLFKGKINYRDRNVIPFTGTHISQFFAGFDFAISAVGYNSFEELQAARVPALYYSLEKGMDDQIERIQQKALQGLCTLGSTETAKI